MDDEMHFCWEQCCDQGPHSCICGNDCDPLRPEPYTPTTERMRAAWLARWHDWPRAAIATEEAAFDHWLAGVRAEARAEALHDAADDWSDLTIAMHGQSPADWLRERANQQHPTTKEN